MKNIIVGAVPQSKNHQSVKRGNVTPEQEKKWATELAACFARHKDKTFSPDRPFKVDFSHEGFNAVDESTGELLKKSPSELKASARRGVSPVTLKTGAVKRFRYERERVQLKHSNICGPNNQVRSESDLKLDIKCGIAKPFSAYHPTSDVEWEYVNGKKAVADDQKQFTHLHEWSDTRLVSEVTIGTQDVFISNTIVGGRAQKGGGFRGKISEWSKKSRAKCEKHIRNVPDGSIKYFLTLTYPREFTNDGIRAKRDLSAMRKRLRRMGVRDDIWFLEFQNRGAPHFHLYLGQCPTGNLERGIKACSQAWYEVVGSGDPKHLKFTQGGFGGKNKPCLELMRNPHAASYYAVKYVVKAEQKEVPDDYLNVGRFWGYGGELKPIYETYWARGHAACKAGVEMIRIWKLAKFGGFVGEDLTLYSATLRGGAKGDWLERLMGYSGWCPD